MRIASRNQSESNQSRKRGLFLLVMLLCLSFCPSAKAADTSPVYSVYNTFLDMQCYLELVSSGDYSLYAKLSVYNPDGTLKRYETHVLEPGTQRDIDLNAIVGKEDIYGVVKVEFNDTLAEVTGRTSCYRLDDNGETYSFVYAIELQPSLSGTTYSISNSFDPQGMGYLVANWASVINLSDTTQTFTHNLYTLSGTLVRSSSVSLGAYQRFDLEAGHEIEENVYLNEFVPDNSGAEYLAFTTRYGSDEKPEVISRDYNFAVPLVARTGSSEDVYVPIVNLSGGCWTQSNWVEVVNVTDDAVTATLTFRNDSGTLFKTVSEVIYAKSQVHFNARDLLETHGRERGVVKVSSSAANSLITQSAVYYHDCSENMLQTAYVVPSQVPAQTELIGSYNRFLEMKNQLVVIGASGVRKAFDLDLGVFGESGSVYSNNFSIEHFATLVFDLNDEEYGTSADTFGSILVEEDYNRPLLAYVVRSRLQDEGEDEERVDFALPLPVR